LHGSALALVEIAFVLRAKYAGQTGKGKCFSVNQPAENIVQTKLDACLPLIKNSTGHLPAGSSRPARNANANANANADASARDTEATNQKNEECPFTVKIFRRDDSVNDDNCEQTADWRGVTAGLVKVIQ